MLALKSSDIDLTKSETRTLLGFGFIYIVLILIIISSFSFLYYNFQKDLMLQKERQNLQKYSNDLIFKLKNIHINFDKYNIYPRDKRFNSAIYDSEKKLIFSTFKSQDIDFEKVEYLKNSKIYFIKEPESFYLGAKYVIIEIDEDKYWFEKVKKEILVISFIFLVIMLILGYFLSKLFLRPMRDALHLLDRFIKDTTHELNTPISAIITNIEMIDRTTLDIKMAKKINRIEIGAKTVSNIYEDLTYITLENKIISQNENLNLSNILYQRVEYFKSLANVKKINFNLDILPNVYIMCDYKKISKVVDNILSNAIKYNKIYGKISIVLKKNYLCIKDTGKGIHKDALNNLFERYSRFDKSVGGFGIGLNIVYLIIKEYGYKIDISSEIKKGTKVEIKW